MLRLAMGCPRWFLLRYAIDMAAQHQYVSDAKGRPVSVIVPTTSDEGVLIARAGGSESDTVLVEGASSTLFDVIGAEFARGRPFTALEDREAARVAAFEARVEASVAAAHRRNRARAALAAVVGAATARPPVVRQQARPCSSSRHDERAWTFHALDTGRSMVLLAPLFHLACNFSAAATQQRVHGIARRRSSPIGSPVTSQ